MRVSASEVEDIIDTSKSIDSFINTANIMVNNNLEGKGLEDNTLAEIEKWLTAHLIATADGVVEREKIADIEERYSVKQGLGLDYTSYGQQVKLLDTTGTLANLGKKKAEVKFV